MQYPRLVAFACFFVSLSATAGMKLCASTSVKPECREAAGSQTAVTAAPATTQNSVSDEFWIFRVI